MNSEYEHLINDVELRRIANLNFLSSENETQKAQQIAKNEGNER